LKRPAFTLIEVLVVVAMIALLLSLALPAMSQARRSARATQCLSNVRSLEIAQIAYADTYKGAIVEVGLPHGGSGDPAASYVHTLEEFYGTAAVLRSPGDVSSHWPVELGGQGVDVNGRFRLTSYGMSNYLSSNYGPGLSPREPFNRMEKIIRPSLTVQFLLMAESGSYAVSDHPHVEGWGNAARAPSIASSQTQIDKWGGKRRSPLGLSNYGFLDGHASTLRFEEVYVNASVNRFNPEIAN
jgi:prepilin-type N-terminal cleavage/methylation domain-containing protein/prepilin-type processing-associated H-X9-DG protein